MPGHAASFAKIRLLLWSWVKSDHVRTVDFHAYGFSCLSNRSNSASMNRSKTESMVSCFEVAIALNLSILSRLIFVITLSCFIGLTTFECIFHHCRHSPLPALRLPTRDS